MKKIFVIFGLLSALLVFDSCQKDSLESNKNTVIDPVDQQSARTCGMQSHMNKLLSDPTYKKRHLKKIAVVDKMSDFRGDCSDPVILPVAIHFQGISNPDLNCLRILAQSQIDVLNNDYQGINADITNWTTGSSSSFPGISNGEACFKFCIATKNHPNGYSLSEGDPAVTINTTTGDSDSNWSGYINIFVQANTGVLGYAPLGGAGNGDGIVVDANAFGTGSGCGSISPQSPYDLGRTLTHEMGHYLLLDHIWGGGCSQDDEVADTPPSNEPYYGCPSLGASSCSSTDMHMNYMDYTNDACMYMFSNGQVSRSTNYISSSLQALADNAQNVCSEGGGPTPTCTDGIQNGQETGVDCGGPDCTPCDVASSCDVPTNIGFGLITETTAIINWTAEDDAQSYMVAYKVVGTSSFTTENTGTNSITLVGLSAEIEYEIKVKSVCGSEVSNYSSLVSFTTESSDPDPNPDCDYTTVNLQIILDDYGSETTWLIADSYGELVASGGPYEDEQSGTQISTSICLEDDCYVFEFNDAAGDGLCCDYGNGSFQLLNELDKVIIGSDGTFGGFVAGSFCVETSSEGSLIKKIEKRVGEKNPEKIRAAKARKLK